MHFMLESECNCFFIAWIVSLNLSQIKLLKIQKVLKIFKDYFEIIIRSFACFVDILPNI